MSHPWMRPARARSLTLLATLLAALGVLSFFVARAEAVPLTGSANPLPGSSFEGGDANQEASNVLRTDWASPGVNPVSASPDPNANDNIFAGGAEGKENAPGNWNFVTQDGGSTPGKNNILDAYTHTPAGSGDVFLDLAFTRGSDTGTTYMAFELNKRTDLWNNGKVNIPCRTTGDIIVSYQVSGNSPDVILQKWTSTASDAATGCATTGTLTDYTAVIDNVNAQGAVNAAPIQNFLPSSYPWPGNVIPAKLFGEASLNLTSLLSGALGTPCFSFGSIWMHTRASTSDSSNLDDYIAPRPLLVRNCSASGTKFHDLDADGAKDAGEPGLAGFRMWADYDEDGVRDAGEPFGDTDANGNYVIANIQDPSGTYAIREQLSEGAGTGDWTCSFPASTAPGGAFPCAHTGIEGATTPNVTGKDFGNYKPAVVRVEKQTVPDGAAGAFAFTSTLPGKGTFELSDGGVEPTTVTPGTYSATETPHADFDLTGIACTDGDSTGAGETATFRVQSGETVTCTFTNTRKTGKLTVRKVLDPANDPGTFDLAIGDDVVVDDGGHLAQGSRTLPTGTGYTVSEDAGTGTSLAKYASAIECRDGDTVVSSGTGTSLAGVPVIQGHEVVCTFTNTRRAGKLTVVKDLLPASDAGRFDLRIGGDVVKAGAGDGDSGSKVLAPGDYDVSELAADGTSLAKYDASVACDNGQSGTGSSLAGVHVDSNDDITCTITNERRKGSLTVVKDLVPTTDGGTFDLKVGDDVVAQAVGDGGQGGKDVAPGTYTVSEAGAAGTPLADYDKSIACVRNGDPAENGNGASLDVAVDSNDAVVCTITNSRRPGKLTVVKNLEPAGDGGTFDLKIGDDVVAAGAGDGDSGSTVLAPGDYDVSEVAAAGTSLAKYDASIACDNGQSGSGASLAEVHVDSNDDITCTITNTRRAGSLTVVKDLLPADDGGTFDLKVGDEVVKAAAGDGGTGSKAVAPGTYTVSEAGAGDTSLAKYDKSIACVRDGEPAESGDGASLDVAVDSNDNVVCTITNERRAGSITVIKDLLPADDGGTFDLKVGDEVVKAAAGDGGTGTKAVAPGTYSVSEAAAGDTSLADYDSDVECVKNQAAYKSGTGTSIGGLELDSGDAIVCTITNVRRGSVTLSKTEGGKAPTSTWTFRLTGGPDNVDITKDTAANGTLSFGSLKPGAYTLCEIDLPAGWHSSLGADACVELEIEPGEAETVAVDNTRPATLVVKEGDLVVHHGDTITYTFDVSNAGNTPLKDVTVEDDRCDSAPVRDAANDANDDGDALLEAGEVWRFTCTKAVSGDHGAAEENPIVNVATAHAFDADGNEVTDTDDHDTTIIHPGIAVNKELRRLGDGGYRDGDAGDTPLQVHRGDTIQYRFTVTNTGDTPLTVAFSDPKCDEQPTAPDTGDADADGKLDTGETWTYRCSHLVTDADADPLDNTVTVTGTDVLGGDKGTVTAEDTERADIAHPDIAVDKQVRRLGVGAFVDAGLQAHIGDTLEYRFAVTDGDSDTPIAGVELTDPRCDAGTLDGPVKTGGNTDELLEDGETWTYTCTHVITDADPNPLPNTATATGRDTVGCPDVEGAEGCGEVEDEDTATVSIINPKTLVVKEGNQFAYPGDTVTFTFAVTNAGDTPLHDVAVTDDRCAPVTGPTEKRGGNADDLLDPGETWMFTCAKQIPVDHKIGDQNPIRNVATATAKDVLDKPVTSTDDHLVRVLHPAIDIEKTGPANATVGTPLGYTLTVTNPGDVPFAAQDVAVADPRCEAPPAGPATGADQTPGQLDPGDAWTYTCTAQTTGQPAGTFVNTATVTAKDFNGRGVTDTDDFPTVLAEEQGVLPEEIVSGFARLRGPSGCVKTAFNATVRGRRIARVTFYVDGKKRKRIVAKSGQRVFRVKVRPGSTVGVHRVTARVVFKASSRTKTRTLRLTYRRCVRQVVTPQFTG